jgi:macrodomain Ter protein organizer (MatP/YcbG family)
MAADHFFKRRSIDINDKLFQIGKELARDRDTTLSGLIRMLIADAYRQEQQKQERKVA